MRVGQDGLASQDGSSMRLIACGDVDLVALEPWRVEAAIHGFELLLRGLTSELVLMIHVRRLARSALDDPGVGTLTESMNRHWRRRLTVEAVYGRRVVLGVRGGSGGDLDRDVDRVQECLGAAGIAGRLLDAEALRAHLSDLGIGSRRTLWTAAPRTLQLGGLQLRAGVLDRLPGIGVAPGWLAPLVRCDTDCDIAVHLLPEPRHRAVGLLSRRMRDLGAHRLLETDRGVVPDAGVEAGLEAARQLRERLARNAGQPLRLWISAIARGRSAPELEDSWRRLRGAFAATMGHGRAAHFQHLGCALAAWGLRAPAGAGKLVDSQAAASCIPWLQAGVDDGGGYRLGRMSDSGLPVRIAPFMEPRYANANVGIFAASGQGKSFLIGGILMEARRHGIEAIVVDPEGEYRGLVESLGGQWLDLIQEAAVNPFDIGDDGVAAATTVVDVCAMLCGGITDLERAAVEAAARQAQAQARARRTTPMLRHCLGALMGTAPRVAAIVDRFVTGSLSGFLDRPTAPAWGQPLLAVGHRDLREELIPVTTLLLGRHLWQLVRTQPRRRHIVIDEVGMLSTHPELRQLLAQLARRCRKYRSSLVVATQNVQDLLRSEEGSVVASNCAIVFCGGHRAVEAAAMERAFGLTEAQRRLVERASRGDFVLLAGSRRGLMTVELPGDYADLIHAGRTAILPGRAAAG